MSELRNSYEEAEKESSLLENKGSEIQEHSSVQTSPRRHNRNIFSDSSSRYTVRRRKLGEIPGIFCQAAALNREQARRNDADDIRSGLTERN